MAITAQPRSAAEATRFTPTTPHASRRTDGPPSSSSSSSSSSRFQAPGGSASQPPSQPPQPPSSSSSGPAGETPAQRVARLRAAHQAAKNAQVSRLDRVINSARHTFDSVHRVTIFGLMGFTVLAGLMTAYTAVDMLRFNRRRKEEFRAAQAQMQADSLAAARLAYMRGAATPEQTALVEEAQARGESGSGSSFFQVPSLLGTPVAADRGADSGAAAASTLPNADVAATGLSAEDDEALGAAESDLVRALEERQAAKTHSSLGRTARAALERERENQRQGGPLDRMGLESGKGPAAATATDTNGNGQSWWKFW
ncbi:hypothetical protein SPI_01912 [Niveomyces insectorum RCEF 264]|uniref:Uncharacterized protein n=1 Tax=Niveomyces insectorum RCEF 264 TaxID=1081102 RepID=A0A167ZC30_9HYPO|nr:hypothetical protein SPI_01912 [Niveomyces insectorum RCEF 264]